MTVEGHNVMFTVHFSVYISTHQKLVTVNTLFVSLFKTHYTYLKFSLTLTLLPLLLLRLLTTYFQFRGWRHTLHVWTNQNHCCMSKLNDKNNVQGVFYWEKTNHPISSNNHPSAITHKAIHCLKCMWGVKNNGNMTKYEAVHPKHDCELWHFSTNFAMFFLFMFINMILISQNWSRLCKEIEWTHH